MANIIITSTTNSIKVDFGVYSTALGVTRGIWKKDHIVNITELTDMVDINFENQPDWKVSFDGVVDTFQVDSLDGVAPTSNTDLYDKLIALIA
jgi:hypothetical protein